MFVDEHVSRLSFCAAWTDSVQWKGSVRKHSRSTEPVYCLGRRFGRNCEQIQTHSDVMRLRAEDAAAWQISRLPCGPVPLLWSNLQSCVFWISTSKSTMHKFIAHSAERAAIPCREMGPWVSGGHQAPRGVSHPNSFGCVTGNESRRITSTEPKSYLTCTNSTHTHTHTHTHVHKHKQTASSFMDVQDLLSGKKEKEKLSIWTFLLSLHF